MIDALRIVPFAEWHLAALDLRPWDALAFGDADKLAAGRLMAQADHSSTILVEGFPGVCFFAGECAPGVVVVSMCSDRRAERYRKSLHRLSRSILQAIFDAPECRRLECNVVAGNHQGEKWIRSQGFEFECRRRQYFPRNDALLFSRVKSWL